MEKFPLVKCPFCFEELIYNNAVFRCTTGEKTVDKYLKEYQAVSCGNLAFEREDFGFIDPAFLKKNQIKTEDGFITEVEDPDPSATYPLEQRLCPYCHNKLIRKFGKKNAKYIAVVGVTNSGKTTFLSAVNASLSDRSWSWESLDYNQNKPLEDVTDMYVNNRASAKVATREIQGPYYYELNCPSQGKKGNCENHIVFLDVPGEFYCNPDKLSNALKLYLSAVDGIIFIVNAAESVDSSGNARTVNATDILQAFGQQGIEGRKKVAIVFNKLDLVKDQLNITNLSDFLPEPTGDAVDTAAVNQRSERIVSLMLADGQIQNPTQNKLSAYMKRIQQAFGDSSKMFATSLVFENKEDGTFLFRSHGAETPFLWLLSEIGAFPKK